MNILRHFTNDIPCFIYEELIILFVAVLNFINLNKQNEFNSIYAIIINYFFDYSVDEESYAANYVIFLNSFAVLSNEKIDKVIISNVSDNT